MMGFGLLWSGDGGLGGMLLLGGWAGLRGCECAMLRIGRSGVGAYCGLICICLSCYR